MNTEMTTRETELLAANAALELEVVRLRDALKHIKYETDIHGNNLNRGIKDEAVKALSTPFTPTALNELIEKVEKMTIERCAVITAMSIIDMPTTVEISTVRKYSKAIRALPVGQIKLEELL